MYILIGNILIAFGLIITQIQIEKLLDRVHYLENYIRELEKGNIKVIGYAK